MEDRFKFRVWDNLENIYLPNDNRIGIMPNGQIICLFGETNKIVDLHKDFVVEQCTGLKDKKGKLIYEGDIVELKETEAKSKVTFSKKGAYFEYQCVDESDCDFDMEFSNELEIIGNIHENPELLESEENNER